jgi:signal transduction histidine kinase
LVLASREGLLRFRFFSGLRGEVIGSLVVISLAAILLVGALILYAVEGDYLRQQVRAAHGLLSVTCAYLAEAIEKEQSGRVKIPWDIWGRDELSPTYLFWVDREGRVQGGVAPLDARGVWKDRDMEIALGEGEWVSRLSGSGSLWPVNKGQKLLITAPLISSAGEILGGVHMEVQLKPVAFGLLEVGWVLGLYMVVVVVILVALGSHIISRNVLKPLGRMIEVADKIAKGDEEIPWGSKPPHEIGQLHEALRAMYEAITSQRHTLRSQLQELEKAHNALKETQKALVRSEKLATVGRLSAGVAHEVGNPIGSILGYVEILLQEDGLAEPARDCLERIRGEAQRIQRTLRSMLDLSRPSGRSLTQVDIGELVEETLAVMVGHKEMRGIQLKWRRPEESLITLADRDQIQQVLINLVLNAIDAMDGKGVMSIRVGEVDQIEKTANCVVPGLEKRKTLCVDASNERCIKGPFIYLEVEDTGRGIEEGEFEAIFEPFYTTKEPGKGTGLGLTVCMEIVESYNGRILVRSKSGEGSCFSVYLPKSPLNDTSEAGV